MTDGQVRAIQQDQGNIWVGGQFTKVLDQSAHVIDSVNNLAVFDASTGAESSIVPPHLTAGSSPGFVYDIAVDPATDTIYAAGTFNYAGGSNLVGINGNTGAISRAFTAPQETSVMFDHGVVYAGKVTLGAFSAATGAKLSGWTPDKAVINGSIRGHATPPQFRDLVELPGGLVAAACECDSITRGSTTYQVKALIKLDDATGAPQIWSASGNYSPQGDVPGDSAAFGLSLNLDAPDDALYFAAGGSDYSQRVVASTGHQDWKTDTSGSSQAIALFDGDVLVGGHFRWVARVDGQQCGDNDHPNYSCVFAPRLVAMDPGTGDLIGPITQETTSGGLKRYMDRGWNPAVCCAYNGVWALRPTEEGVWVGGEFTRLSSGWSVNAAATAALPKESNMLKPVQVQQYVGRFG